MESQEARSLCHTAWRLPDLQDSMSLRHKATSLRYAVKEPPQCRNFFLELILNIYLPLIKHFLDLKAKAEARKERTNIMVNYFQDIYHNLIENDKYSLDYLVGKQLFTYEWRKFDFSNFKNVITKVILLFI